MDPVLMTEDTNNEGKHTPLLSGILDLGKNLFRPDRISVKPEDIPKSSVLLHNNSSKYLDMDTFNA